IRKIGLEEYKGKVYNLEVEKDNSYVAEFCCIHNCWTPWFSLFGSNSGFNSVEDCYKDQAKYIHALETGLSSDPAMNWRLSQLDKYALVSFSDSHSFWPWRMGRELTVFDIELNYKSIINALRTKQGLTETIEVDPSYGKYHFDGHRACDVCLEPKESNKLNKICPKCGKPLTIGVLNRIEELADRKEGFKPEGAKPFKSLIPLSEVIAEVLGIKSPSSKKVFGVFNKLIDSFNSELNVLLDVPFEKLKSVVDENIAKAIIQLREGNIYVKPGYDGVYGRAKFNLNGETSSIKQSSLDNFS
ncbi:MAG: endonuclease Q family protein, partial [Nanoarchaeota archaeon]|nr:endonuclease Q family protein [Nanoarchaeota archaeon]